MKGLSIVIPSYNNSDGLIALIEALQREYPEAQIVAVDDGSEPEHWMKLLAFSGSPKLQKIRLAKNFGQHAALLAGFSKCNTEWVLTMDDDHLELVDKIKALLPLCDKNKALVFYGLFSVQRNILRLSLAGIYRIISRMMGAGHGKGSGFRLIHQSIYIPLFSDSSNFTFIDERIRWYTNQIMFVDLNAKISPRKSRYRILDLIGIGLGKSFYATDFPLRLITFIGAFMALVNVLIGSFFLYKKLIDKIDVPGFTSLIVSILFSSGLLLFGIGILANYIRQLLLRVNNAPVFHIQEEG